MDPKNKKKVLSCDVMFDELTSSRSEANDSVKKDVVAREIPMIKEITSRENQPEEEEQQAPENVHVKPTNQAQSRAKKTIKPTKRSIEACYALLAGEGNPSCFQEATESNEWQ